MFRLLLAVFLSVAPALAQLSISPATLPNGRLDSTYAAAPGTLPIVAERTLVNLSVVGSQGPFTFSVVAGTLPPGLTLGSFGDFFGVTTQQGTFSFTVEAVNVEVQQSVRRSYSIVVLPPLSLAQTVVIGSSVFLPLQCPELDVTWDYAAQGGPAGLTVDSFSGSIFGVPTGPSGSSLMRWFCDSQGGEFRVDITFGVQAMPTLTFSAKEGSFFAQNILFGGGSGPFFYSVFSGEPPPGLALDSETGQLTGTPELAGTFTFVVEKMDSRESFYRATVRVVVAEGLIFTISPATLALEAIADGPPVSGAAVVESSLPGDSYSLIARTTRGGRWLSATPSQGVSPRVLQIQADPTGLAPGQYGGFIDAQSASASGPSATAQLQVILTVLPAEPDELSISPRGIQESFREGGTALVRQLQVANLGSGPLSFTAQASTENGGGWLSVFPSAGTASGSAPATLRVSMDPRGLPAGAYKGAIEIDAPAAGGSVAVPVTITVSGDQGLLRLSQTGLSFRVEQGSNPLAASFFVQEALGRSINWQAAATTISGGPWLAVSPASGATGPQSSVDVVVSSSRLSAGRYFGQVAISSPQASNSPQTATVFLDVEAPGTLLGPLLSAKGLAFVSPPMLTNQLTRGVFVGNPTVRAQTLEVAASFPGGPAFFNATVDNPRIGPGSRATLVVRVNAAALGAGVYRGFLDLRFAAGGPTARLEVMLVVAQGAPGGPLLFTEDVSGGPSQTACSPASLHIVVVEPGDNFIVEQGQPVHIEAFVVNNCGQVPTDAVVWARFSNGDEPVALTRNSRGGYSGVWTPLRAGTTASSLKAEAVIIAQQTPPDEQDNAQITIQANQLNNTGGATQIGGSLGAAAGVPIISPGGAVSAASFAARNPLPPGAFISIFGGNLAPNVAVAGTLPLPTELNSVSVTAAGKPVALHFVSPGQINGVLPFDLTADAAQQIVVKHGNAISTPESVAVSEAQPAVFTQNSQGFGLGYVAGVRPDGTQYLVGPANRLRVGDAAVIYCAGLGQVDQDVDAAEPGPSNPLARALTDVTVTIGGVAANVFYAGLAPGFAGLYQVNAIVQPGTPSGVSVPLVLTANEIQNPAVTVAVE